MHPIRTLVFRHRTDYLSHLPEPPPQHLTQPPLSFPTIPTNQLPNLHSPRRALQDLHHTAIHQRPLAHQSVPWALRSQHSPRCRSRPSPER